jgi:disulfide bond formation protein DsbB
MMISEEKQALLDFLNHNLSLATLIGFIVLLFWIIDLVALRAKMFVSYRKYYAVIAKYALPLGFFLTLFSTLLSLVYSDYLGVLPCGLCWFQRIFIYSMVFIFGTAWYKNDKKVFDYILTLSIAGLIVALYHQYLQMGYSELIPCPAIASTVNCDKPTFMEYGFITFPFMAVVTFGYTIMLSLTAKMFNK